MSNRILVSLGIMLVGVAMASVVVAFAPASPQAPVSAGAALNTPYRSALSDLATIPVHKPLPWACGHECIFIIDNYACVGTTLQLKCRYGYGTNTCETSAKQCR